MSSPQITHLSHRFYKTYCLVNVVFKSEESAWLQQYCEEYVKNTLWEVEDPQKITLHFVNSEWDFVPDPHSGHFYLGEAVTPKEFDISSLKRTGYYLNEQRLLNSIPKHQSYFYREYITINPITKSAIGELNRLKNDKLASLTNPEAYLRDIILAIKTLELYYD